MIDLCRCCLSSNKSHLQPLFEDKLANLFQEFTTISISSQDGLSKYVCNCCANRLQEYQHFKALCLSSDAELKKRLTENERKLCIDLTDEREQECKTAVDNGEIDGCNGLNEIEGDTMEKDPLAEDEDPLAFTVEPVEQVCEEKNDRSNKIQILNKSLKTIKNNSNCRPGTIVQLPVDNSLENLNRYNGLYACTICYKSFKDEKLLIDHSQCQSCQQPKDLPTANPQINISNNCIDEIVIDTIDVDNYPIKIPITIVSSSDEEDSIKSKSKLRTYSMKCAKKDQEHRNDDDDENHASVIPKKRSVVDGRKYLDYLRQSGQSQPKNLEFRCRICSEVFRQAIDFANHYRQRHKPVD